MKLYYSPFACSLAAHIVCREAGLSFSLHRSELATKRVEGESSLYGLNPMGQVPTLVTDAGDVMTENTAVLTYLADLAPGTGLVPAAGDPDRYEVIRWLSFVSTEVHKKGLWFIFAHDAPEAVKEHARSLLPKALGVLDARLASRTVLVGDRFTAADAYLLWALMIAPHGGVSLDAFEHLRAYQRLHMARPAVREAVAFERAQHERAFAA